MSQVLKDHYDRFRTAFDFLGQDLPGLAVAKPDVWRAFVQHSGLSADEAAAAVRPHHGAPLIFASDLGWAYWGMFNAVTPGRIEIASHVLQQFAAHAASTDAQQFLRAKVLHEMCHWGCHRKNIHDPDIAGENFEKQAFHGELTPPWYTGDENIKSAAIASPAQIGKDVFTDPAARAELLVQALTRTGSVPGRSADPHRQVFSGSDVALGMPRGFRNNNPGNIRISGDAWLGLAERAQMTEFQRQEASFCVFQEPEWGLRAIAVLLRKYKFKYGLDTPRKIISRWAPASDNNDVSSYSTQLAHALGISPDDRVNADDDATAILMLRAIARHENGDRPPYADMQYETALRLMR